MSEPAKSTAAEILAELESLGNESTKKMYAKNYAPDYIRKVEERGAIGKKRKSVKC